MTAHIISIDYLNGFCGSGKTYAIAAYAKVQAERGQKVLIVQPTTKLISQTFNKTFPDHDIPFNIARMITSETHPFKVVNTIIEHLSNLKDGGEILLISQSAFFSIPYFPNKHKWTVIIDEIPSVNVEYHLNIPDSHKILTDHIEIVDCGDTRYHQIAEQTGSSYLKNYAQNKRGDILVQTFSAFASHVVNPNWNVYVVADNYHRLISNEDMNGINRQLIALGYMSPLALKGFGKMIIAGACFEESMMFILWSKWKDPNISVQFRDITEKFKLRYQSHENGELIDIYFAIEKGWSKSIRQRVVELADGTEAVMIDAIIMKIKDIIGNDASAYFANADIKDVPFENCVRLPSVSHGLNTYQGIDHVVCMMALNPISAHFTFLQKFADIGADAVQTAMMRQAIYQAACRTSIRDITNTRKKKWFVPDLMTAEWLRDLFPGARIHDLGLFANRIVAGKPRIHADPKDRHKAFRDREARARELRLRRAVRAMMINGTTLMKSHVRAEIEVREDMAREMANAALSPIGDRSKFQETFFNSKMDKTGVAFEGSFVDLIDIYRSYYTETFPSKGDSPAYSPAHYIADNGTDTSRGYDNIAWSRNIILDYDGGDLTPEQFAAYFPAWTMIIHSSWSHSAECPKWRVLIPTDQLVDIEGYKLITGHIISVLAGNGWVSTKEIEAKPGLRTRKGFSGVHGFDVTKLSPACVLFVPSQGARPKDRFFIVNDGGHRGELDVLAVIAQAEIPDAEEAAQRPVRALAPPVLPEIPATASPALRAMLEALANKDREAFEGRKAERIRKALEEFSFSGSQPGHRDAGIFRLALQLRNSGCNPEEIKDHGYGAVNDNVVGRDAKRELKQKIDRAIKALRN